MTKRTVVNEAMSKEAHDATLKLLAGIGSYFAEGDRQINEIIFVPLAIMARIVRVHEATLLLLKDEYVSEAAVLALTQFELRIDLLDVASDIKRATSWVEHADPGKNRDNMRCKLNRHFGKANADRLYEVFRYLSGIKHGNPLYSELAFPIKIRKRGAITVTTGPVSGMSAKAFSRGLLSYSTYQLVWAAQVVNKLVAQYAVVDLPVRQKVQDLYVSLRPVEGEFRAYCRRKLRSRQSFLGLKERRARTVKRNLRRYGAL